MIKNFPACCANTDSSIKLWKRLKSAQNSSLLLKPTSNLGLLGNRFNNATPKSNNDSENVYSSKYYDIVEIHIIEIPNKNKSVCLCHINSYSLNKNFDEFQRLLSCKKTNFDIIGVTKTRLTTQVSSLNNLKLFLWIYSNRNYYRWHSSLHCSISIIQISLWPKYLWKKWIGINFYQNYKS